ncbi:MAG TPA: hypothetical protein VJ001_10865 [Rhodocyclaceae bacterium]|nr:hypothetical protein [Rhodocyclaceae bacterium]
MKKPLIFALLVAACTVATAQTAAPAAPAQDSAALRLAGNKVDKDQLTFNMESVGKLLESSSAARQIEASKAPEALSRREKAREVYKTAKAALESGDLAKASALLTEVRATFFDAVRFAAPEEVRAKKLENDYKMRLDSVNALLGAYKRVSSEKSAKGVTETVAQIEKSVAEADKLAKAGKFKEGRDELDRAYLVAKAGVSSLRSGDTLVRSLNFANKEEEYHYEIDRNNTHQMLIKVLVDGAKAEDGMIKSYVGKANELRNQAEAAAAKKDYADAVKLLEDSTAELVRAIRNAGIYIPG